MAAPPNPDLPHDLPGVVAWIRDPDAPEPRTVQEGQFFASRLWTLRTRGSAAYKGIYVLLLMAGISDCRSGEKLTSQRYFDEAVDIHHVFPQAWCEKAGIERDRYNSILNKTPLAARTNRIIGGYAPSEYLTRLAHGANTTVDAIKELIEPHLFDPDLLQSDDFESTLSARQSAILEMIGESMGKPTQEG